MSLQRYCRIDLKLLIACLAALCAKQSSAQYVDGGLPQYHYIATDATTAPTVEAALEQTPPSDVVDDVQAPADPSSNEAINYEQTIEELKQRIQSLENDRKKAIENSKPKESSESKPNSGKAKESEESKPLWTDVSKEKWNVRLGGHLQSDFIHWAKADDAIPNAQDYFEFRRVRLLAEGTGYGNLDFRLQMTMEPESVGTSPAGSVTSPEVKDAYFSMNEIPYLGRFRFGNFFVPFSLEQVTNDTFNIFLERSVPSQGIFAVDREVGMALYNCTADRRLSWATGVFIDSVSEGLKEKIDDNQGVRVSGRVCYLPYYDETTDGRFFWHTGIGTIYTKDGDDRVRFSARPQIRESVRLIDTGNVAAEDYTTFNIENAFTMGRFTLQTESFLSTVQRLNGQAPTVNGTYAHISYFLTGESRKYEPFGQHGAQYGRNTPFSNFFVTPAGISWGAWEMKARWSHLDLAQLDAGQYNDMTFGFNWYWNDRVRYMFDWIHPMTDSETTFGAVEADIIGMRFDFNW